MGAEYMNLRDAYGDESKIDARNAKGTGLIDVGSAEATMLRMRMMERVAIKNKASIYTNAVRSELSDSSLSLVFFSRENMQIVTNAIRAGVYAASKQRYVVSPPNWDTLNVIMRSVFLTEVAQGEKRDVRGQVERMNSEVVSYCVRDLYSASRAYEHYVKAQSELPTPISLPQNHDRDFKPLELPQF